MGRYKSGITWFKDNAFLGSEIQFSKNASRWKLERKIIEHEYCQTEEDRRELGLFVASNFDAMLRRSICLVEPGMSA